MSKKKSYKYLKPFISCHEPQEIVKNLTLCSKEQVMTLLEKGKTPDVLVPLDSLSPRVWNYLKPDQEILYYPIYDYGILADNNLEYLVNKILSYMNNGKSVWLFCLGGHGRTGYIAACVLGKLGIQDPIAYLWNHYCLSAIETSEQIFNIMIFLGAKFENLTFYYEYFKKEEEKIVKESKYSKLAGMYSFPDD